MSLHSFIIIHLIVALLLPCAPSKTLLKRTEIDREPEENESSDQSESLHEAHHHSFKHDRDLRFGKHRKGRASKVGDSDQNDREYALIYRNQEPMGMLQRVHDNYQLLPLHAEESILVDVSPIQKNEDARKRIVEEKEGQEDVGEEQADEGQFADAKYPYIFAKSKVDSSRENESSRMFEKRKVKVLNKHPLFNASSLSSELSNIGTNEDGENMEFKGILHDMGLIEEPHLDKRELQLAEDENMELGTNKIDLIKVEDRLEGQAKLRPAKRSEWVSTEHYEQIQYPESRAMNEDQQIEEYINKHLAQVKKGENEREKRRSDIEKQMEKQIKERLQKIKEEVRNEIDNLKAGNNEKSEEDDDEENARKNSEEEDNAQRWKRNILSNLMEEETSDLNPVMATDENPVSHIRRRRSVQVPDKEYLDSMENHFQLRKLLEFSDQLNGDQIDDGEGEIFLQRDKRGCLCEDNKDCKCNRHKSYITRPDRSSFIYLDEAPMGNNTAHKAPTTNISGTSNNFRPEHNTHALPLKQEDKKLKESAYKLDIGPDSYKLTADKNDWLQARRTSNGFLNLVAVHGGVPVLNHLISIRERSMLPKMRSKRMAMEKEKLQQQTLGDMSENDLFGAPPKKFEGDELARFKRI
ncbi:trichohyalin-like [Euwallacea similis]|uniref:trichohyalin-like n=1 Tax=Euwallacea similis TaxID=1736056 RepID=UPI00344BA36C